MPFRRVCFVSHARRVRRAGEPRFRGWGTAGRVSLRQAATVGTVLPLHFLPGLCSPEASLWLPLLPWYDGQVGGPSWPSLPLRCWPLVVLRQFLPRGVAETRSRRSGRLPLLPKIRRMSEVQFLLGCGMRNAPRREAILQRPWKRISTYSSWIRTTRWPALAFKGSGRCLLASKSMGLRTRPCPPTIWRNPQSFFRRPHPIRPLLGTPGPVIGSDPRVAYVRDRAPQCLHPLRPPQLQSSIRDRAPKPPQRTPKAYCRPPRKGAWTHSYRSIDGTLRSRITGIQQTSAEDSAPAGPSSVENPIR